MRRRDFTVRSAVAALTLLAPRRLDASGAAATIANNDGMTGPTKGPWRRLFLDATVVESQSDLTRRYHAAEKHSSKPIIVADRPWEGSSAVSGPYVYGTVLRDGDLFRMWYQLLYQGNHTGYAESRDGIQWEKPELDVIQYNGAKTNLVVSDFAEEKTGGHCHNPSVILRAETSDPARRYALYGFDNKSRHPRVAYSSDGLHWRYPAESLTNPLLTSSDVVNFGYDPYESRYYCTWKTRNRRGRAVGIAFSRDGDHWNKPFDGPTFVADDLDPDDTQIYGMPAFPYQGMYIGLPWIYVARYFRFGQYSVDKLYDAQSDSPRTMETQLAWSWDLVNWTRPPARTQFILRGEEGSWDSGMILTARAPVVVGDKLYFYYGGTDKVHDEKRVRAAIGLATMRIDGFCSMSASDSKEGWMISRREPMREPTIKINAKTAAGGSVTAEILDRKNRVLPGFSRQECIAFQGDAVSHELQWSTRQFADNQRRSDYKIRFWLNKADLFSYLPSALDPEQPDLARFPAAGP